MQRHRPVRLHLSLPVRADQVRDEGRYPVFADLNRVRGQFPPPKRRREDGSWPDVMVWCSNDYLGMGQRVVVCGAVAMAITAGAG